MFHSLHRPYAFAIYWVIQIDNANVCSEPTKMSSPTSISFLEVHIQHQVSYSIKMAT